MEDNRISMFAPFSVIPQEFIVALELVTEGNDQDAALINTIGNVTVAALLQKGYTTKLSEYTGHKGIESFFIELVTTTQQIASFAVSNHVTTAEGIADISGLITIFGGIIPIIKRVQDVYKKQKKKTEDTIRPIKMTVEIDGVQLIIELSDINQADAALKLAQRYRSAHSAKATQVTTKSKVKVKCQVPVRKQRRRR